MPRSAARAVAVAAMVAGLCAPGAAHAATANGVPVTLRAAKAALPAASSLPPGGVTRTGLFEFTKAAPFQACNKTMTAHNTGEETAIYTTENARSAAQVATWTVAVMVYADTSGPTADLALFKSMYAKCPSPYKQTVNGATVTMTFVSRAAVSSAGWTGFRLVRDLRTTTSSGTIVLRSTVLELRRGNAIVEISEIVAKSASLAKKQAGWLAAVQKKVLAKLP